MLKVDFIYLVTITHPRSGTWKLAGAFLDPNGAKDAKKELKDCGIEEENIDIEAAPIGVVDGNGIDEPYVEGPIH